jgi:prepilin-type N-terminal cleavage/methylation domain-containing protein
MKRKQSGFTLIEIAIVLVIIGLLLGGVLKGQELINSARVKNLATDFRNIPVYIYAYQDKYRAFPGDDVNTDAHLGATVCVSPCQKGDGNGVLGSPAVGGSDTWDDKTVTNETQQFWIHTRIAGLAVGPVTGMTDYRPMNSLGGAIGIQSNTASFVTITKKEGGGGGTSLIPGTYVICSSGITGLFVKQLDSTMDDGNPDTGAMRATPSAGATGTSVATGSIKDGDSYIVCMGI